MSDLRQTLVDLIAAAKKGEEGFDHAFSMWQCDPDGNVIPGKSGKLVPLEEFRRAIKAAETALEEHDKTASQPGA